MTTVVCSMRYAGLCCYRCFVIAMLLTHISDCPTFKVKHIHVLHFVEIKQNTTTHRLFFLFLIFLLSILYAGSYFLNFNPPRKNDAFCAGNKVIYVAVRQVHDHQRCKDATEEIEVHHESKINDKHEAANEERLIVGLGEMPAKHRYAADHYGQSPNERQTTIHDLQ